MLTLIQNELRVLAVRVTNKGFGFAVLEGPERLIDWGVKECRRGYHLVRLIAQFADLLLQNEPDVLLVNEGDELARRSPRKRAFVAAMARQADRHHLAQIALSQPQVRTMFARLGIQTIYGRALDIVRRFPELGCALPHQRAAWEGGDTRMSIFEAAALALTYYYAPSQGLSNLLSDEGIR